MDVRIDDPWEHLEAARIQTLTRPGRGDRARLADRCEYSVPDADIGPPTTIRRHDGATMDDQIIGVSACPGHDGADLH